MKSQKAREMTQAEKEEKANEMMAYAVTRDTEKRSKFAAGDPSEGLKGEEESAPKNAKFLSTMQKQAYLESDMKLEDRINRNKHY